MLFPDYRPRRLRQSEGLRRMVRETGLGINDFILPLFVIDGKDVKNPIPSMPGHFQQSIDNFLISAQEAYDLGIPAIILFGIPNEKDPLGTAAYAENGIVQKATKAVKDKLPELVVITDVCLCQYTDHAPHAFTLSQPSGSVVWKQHMHYLFDVERINCWCSI